jgi:hypothetical protein
VATETDPDALDAPDEHGAGVAGDAPAAPAPGGPRGGAGRRRVWIAAAIVAVLGVAAFVLVWFEPQALFIDERVDQAVPTAGPTTAPEPPAGAVGEPDGDGTTATAPATTTTPPGPVDLATGTFVSLDHATSGTARVFELADGRRFVRLEGFETDNGPDLFVYLSANPAGGSEGAFDDDYADLGRLQGNIGDQNYEIPADVDPARYASVVVWCDRFDSAFGAADLAGPSAAAGT